MADFTVTHTMPTNPKHIHVAEVSTYITRMVVNMNALITEYNTLKTNLEAASLFIPLDLAGFREVDANGDIGVTAGGGTGTIDIPLWGCQEADGTALAAFADGDSTTPGFAVADSEAIGIRWNNHANPDPIGFQFVMPADVDTSADMTLSVVASKTGATVGDAVTWLVTAFNMVDGALHDADANFGGTSSAMTGDATAKTVQIETLALASANLAAAGSAVSMTIQPTDGTLGTDDVIIEGIRISYTSTQSVASTTVPGGVLGSDSTPILQSLSPGSDGDNAQRIIWAASNNDPILRAIPLHQELNTAVDLVIHARVASGGTTDAVGFTVESWFNEGDTKVTDTSTTNQTTAYTEITATIAAADIPTGAQTLTFTLAPVAHTTDTMAMSACWIEGTKTRSLA